MLAKAGTVLAAHAADTIPRTLVVLTPEIQSHGQTYELYMDSDLFRNRMRGAEV